MDEPVVQVVKEVLEFIERTGSVMISTGFPIAVKYAIANGISKVVTGGVSIIGVILSIFSINNLVKKADKDDEFNNSGEYGAKLTLSIILGLIFLVAFLFSGFISGVKMLIAPEWYAIMNIIELVK